MNNLMKEAEDCLTQTQTLKEKQLFLNQLMNLKTRGRYLDETDLFERDLCQFPSPQSQSRVVSHPTP